MTLQSTYEAIVHEQNESAPRLQTVNICANIADDNSASGVDPRHAIRDLEPSEKSDTREVTIRNTGTSKLLSQRFQCGMVTCKQPLHDSTFDWFDFEHCLCQITVEITGPGVNVDERSERASLIRLPCIVLFWGVRFNRSVFGFMFPVHSTSGVDHFLVVMKLLYRVRDSDDCEYHNNQYTKDNCSRRNRPY